MYLKYDLMFKTVHKRSKILYIGKKTKEKYIKIFSIYILSQQVSHNFFSIEFYLYAFAY